MKRFISLMLAIAMSFGMLPVGEMVAFAGEGETPEIKNVLVTKTYSKPQEIDVMYIEITGENLDGLGKNPVIFIDQTGEPAALSTIVESKKKLHYKIEKPNGVARITVDGEDYPIGADIMPTVLNLTPSNGLVESGQTMTINGSGFKKFRNLTPIPNKIEDLEGEGSSLKFYNKSGSQDNNNVGKVEDDKDTKVTKYFPPETPGGPYRVELKYTDKVHTNKRLTVVDNYVNLFSVVGELDVKGDIKMSPNQGPTGTTVKIKAEELKQTKDMSVFFLTSLDGSDPFTKDNMGIDETYQANAEKAKETDTLATIDVFTVKVPAKLKQGVRYYVVLTNDIKKGEDPTGKILSKKIFDDNVFTVIDNKDTLSINDLSPNRGPETGIDALMQGRYIGTMSPNVFAPNDNSKMIINEGEKINTSSNTLRVSYEPIDTDKTIGNYKLIGGEKGVDVENITRDITIFIGGKATFREGSSFTDSLDKLEIRVPSVNIPEGEDPSKEVTVDVVTKIKYKGSEKSLEISETGSWKNGKFTFEPISYRPKVTTIVPNKIPLDSDNKIAEKFQISIIGENFFKYRYRDDKGITQVKYPVIDLGGQIILDPNIKQPTSTNGVTRIPVSSDDIKVVNKAGIEIDGTSKNDLGTKILITIPKGILIDLGIINQVSRLKVTNPIKNEENITKDEPDKHMGLFDDGPIEFVKVGSEKTPIITEVTPSTVTTDGEKGILIKGANFGDKVSVYLDGEKVTGKRNGTGTEILFDAPKKLEGIYQIIVQNEEGGLATFDEFIYVKTYTNIKLTDFAPKKGSANTLVSIKGESFVPIDPLVRDIGGAGIYKLIGTRVFLGGINSASDVNNYNEVNGKITLKDFNVKTPIVKDNGGTIKAEDYHDSVVLLGKDKYYKVYKNARTGKTILTDGDKDVFEFSVVNGSIYANKTGEKDRKVDLGDPTKVILEAEGLNSKLELKIQTLYQTNSGNNEITGNNVKVLNDGEITFIVPPRAKEGYYDLTVMNPDNKRDSKIGNNGFWYYFQPQSDPKIDEITPNQGSTQGDYFVEIKGEDFKNTPTNKSSIIIGGVVVDAKDVEVSTDGKTIRFKVPKYPGDLNKETDTGRKTVPIVVVNPDGASDSKEYGFTYVIPISNPKINALVLNKGTASGGETVSIEGEDFRFFEPFRDVNNNNKWDDEEPYTDANENGKYDEDEPFEDINKDGSGKTNGKWDPAERYDELNGDGKWTDLRGKKMHELVHEDGIKDKNILPTIYFGNKVVEILSFTEGSIEIKTPKGVKGAVDVYLVNNDYGVSNKVKYTYEASTPKIKNITPKVGRKQGKDKVEILGESFYESKIKLITSDTTTEDKTLQLVQFGDPKDANISNRDIKIDAPKDSGKISTSKPTEVKVGNLTVEYDARGADKTLKLSLDENNGSQNISYRLDYTGYDDGEIFLPTSLLKNGNGSSPTLSYEYVRIKLDTIPGASVTKKLRVDRGFSPDVTLINTGHITLRTPSYYTIGKTKVTIINPDGSEATGEFEYKNPDSNPKIIEIIKDKDIGIMEEGVKVVKINTKGGNIIDVVGDDFRNPAKITIGDILIKEKIEYNPKDDPKSKKLTFTMPRVDDKYADGKLYPLILENEDGGVASSTEANPKIYIKFFKGESNPLVTSIHPKTGPSKGGTEVTIKGKDFRKTMEGFDGKLKVYFDDGINIEEASIIRSDIETIVVKSPESRTKIGQVEPVEATIKVENPDGSIAISKDKFIYTGPTIDNIIKAEGTSMGENIVYIEGRQFEFHGLSGKTMEELSRREKDSLPKVYFGEKQAEIISFKEESDGKGQVIELKVPKGSEEVDVYLENSNGEKSAKVKYGYIATQPIIDYITPNESPQKGGIKAEIFGSGFYESKLRIYKNTKLPSTKEDDKKSMMVVQFAEAMNATSYENISNKNITDANNRNVGIFSNGKTKVTLGNLLVEYNDKGEDNKQLMLTLKDGENKYSEKFEYDKSEIFLPISLLKNDSGKLYDGNELIKISQDKLQGTSNVYRLVIERGYAEDAKLEELENNIQKINIVSIPGYYDNRSIIIEVTNPDGEKVEVDFDYKNPPSNPKIINVVDPKNNDVKKESLSIEGGETIKIKGEEFFTKRNEKEGNLKVVFNPKLEKVQQGKPESSENVITINGEKYRLTSGETLEQTDGEESNVKFIDTNNIIVNNTPGGKLKTGGIIVINPDGSGTPVYEIPYGTPEIVYPQDIRASLINNQYIRINWNKVTEPGNKNVQYEVYVVEGNKRELIGSTATTGFVFRDINPNTTYKFLVRAVGKYGSSKPINESMSNEVRTGSAAGPKDEDGKLGKETKAEKSGDTANIVIGEDAFKDGGEYVIDLTRGTLAGSNKVVMSMAAKIVVDGKDRKIKIVGKDYGLNFSPNVFENSTMVSNKGNANAGVKFEVLPVNTNFDLAENKGATILASKYYLRGRTYVASSSNEIENLNGNMNFVLDYNANLATTRRLQNINLVKYDAYDRKFKNIVGSSEYGTSMGDINELGTFTTTGSRR